MTPLNAQEWLEAEYLRGNRFARELLDMVDNEQDSEDRINALNDLRINAPDNIQKSPDLWRLVEWINDQLRLLGIIEEKLKSEGLTGDADDEIVNLLDTLKTAEDCLRNRKHWTEGDFLDALFTLAEHEPKIEYDL